MKFAFQTVLACPLALGLFITAAPASAQVKLNFVNVDAESYLFLADNRYSQDKYKTDNGATYKTKWSAVTTATLNTPVGTASASSSTIATFTSTAAASVAFTPQRTAINVNDPAHGESFAYATGSFQYGFTVNDIYTLSYTHSVTTTGRQADGTPFGQTFYFQNSMQSPIYTFDQLNGTSSGSFVINPGSYYISVQPGQLNWSDYPSGVGSNTTSLSALFNFNLQKGIVLPPPVAAVPEPASWAMMVGGFGLMGGVMRRRRSPAARFA